MTSAVTNRRRGAASRGAHVRRAGRLLASLALCLWAWQAAATTFRYLTPTEVLLAADLVFIGTVDDVVVEVRDGQPWTVVTLRIDELFRGFGHDPAAPADAGNDSGDGSDPEDPTDLAPESVTLAFLGGESTGAGSLVVSGAPAWRFEETYLIASYQQDGLASPLVGFNQGWWRVSDEGLLDVDGMALAMADDGSPVRSRLGADRSQVVRAVLAVLEGTVDPALSTELPGQPVDGDQPGGQAAEPPAAVPGDEDQSAAQEPDAPRALRVVSVDFDVDDSGGPLLLSELVERAAEAWRSAATGAVELRLTRVPGSANLVRYGNEEWFGPDTVSLTTVGPGGTVTVFVSPTAGGFVHTALVHELGVILGVPESGSGVMASAVRVAADGPSAADVGELVALSLYDPADLTRDGTVDFYDLIALAAAYGGAGVNLAGDLDGDGAVDDADVAVLRQRYQFVRPQQPQQQPPADAQ